MPSSQAAASERRSSADRTVPHEPPKLKTALKTPTSQATNPLQFVKVGPCSLYRTAQEQLQKVQKVVKVKPEVKDEAEDWQSNLDNWKSSRRKRQEHIIERVVEVKKLELEEHDRQRRRSGKTLSEMMENRGRKLSLNLYPEDDSNDLSDLGIGTSSGKSSLSGDAHDDNHSVLSDRDSELDKSQSDVDNVNADNGTTLAFTTSSTLTTNNKCSKQDTLNNGFHHKAQQQQEYDSATTATASSPEPDDYDNVRSYNDPPSNASRPSYSGPSRRSSNISKISDSLIKSPPAPQKIPNEIAGNGQVVKVDINKRREIFEKGNLIESNGVKNVGKVELTSTKSIKERLSILERQKSSNETSETTAKTSRLSVDSVKDRYNWDKLALNKEDIKSRGLLAEELESVKPLKERLETLEKYTISGEQHSTPVVQLNGDYSAKSIKERLHSLDNGRQGAESKKTNIIFHEQQPQIRAENSTPSERSSSPDSEYRAPRATFHQSLDSLDADASSGPDTFERVQSLEELDPYHHPTSRRYPPSNSSTEILLNDADREDSGIHTTDVSSCVSQADDAIESNRLLQQQIIAEQKMENQNVTNNVEKVMVEPENSEINASHDIEQALLDVMGTVENTSTSSLPCSTGNAMFCTNANEAPESDLYSSTSRPIVYQSPRVPFRQTPPDHLRRPKPSYLPGLISACSSETKNSESPSDSSSTTTVCSLNDSKQQLPQQVQQLVRPLPSPRSPSKIPTPLPRKSLSNGSSPSSPAKSLPSSPIKPRVLPLSPHKASEIPVPISPTSPTSPRRALVEVIGEEKVVVEESPHPSYIQRDLQQQQLQQPLQQDHEKINEELATVQQQEKEKVEVEKEEEETALELALEPEQQQLQMYQLELLKKQDKNHIDVDMEQRQGEKVGSLIKQVDELELNVPVAPTPAVRPTTLALDKTMSCCPDFLSPMSPSGKQILPLSFSSDEEIVMGLAFPLGPPTSGEPPKEKPPPPPVDLSDEDNQPIEPLKRLNSTRRIKKEIRSRRSDFLGIESFNDDDLERELTLTKPPPDMASILAEERRIEQLHRRSYDTDSYYEQDSSHERDSGVELGQAEDWTKQPVSPDMSQHSRQSSEPFGATSVTSSEEDEISKKEREIMEVLEREEQWRYENNRERNTGDDSSDIGEKLAHKLRELEEEKMQLERERADIINQQQNEISENQQQQRQQRQRQQEPNPETLRMNEENLRKQEKIENQPLNSIEEVTKEETRLLTEQHHETEDNRRGNKQEIDVNMLENNKPMSPVSSHEDESFSHEVLRVERELLQLEQEELKRQRNNLAYREQQQQHLADQLHEQWKSMQQENQQQQSAVQTRNHYNSNKSHAVSAVAATTVNYRASMPNLQIHDHHIPVMGPRRRPPPPPPIPPAKPLRLVDQRQRDVTIRNSRIPSANSGTRIEAPARSSCSNNSLAPVQQQQQQQQQPQLGQQMSRQTLQALSAAPRPRMIQNDQWVQRRKSDVPRGTHDYSNYQHWVIQEAEQRRINEKNQRKPHATGTTAVPYATPVSAMRPVDNKPLPDSIIQTLTQRVQNRAVQEKPLSPRRRLEHSASQEHLQSPQHYQIQQTHKQTNLNQSPTNAGNPESQEKMLSVSGKKKCSHCGDELGRGAAMIIESLRLFYHMECFKCCVCHVRLGDGLMGTDVRVRNQKLHCHNCYSSDDGVKFSCV